MHRLSIKLLSISLALVVLLTAFWIITYFSQLSPSYARESCNGACPPEPPPGVKGGEPPPPVIPPTTCVGTFQTCEAEGKGTYEGNPIRTCTYTPTPYTEERCRSETYDCNCVQQCDENDINCTTVCETCTRTNCSQQDVSRECKWCDAFLENGDCGQGFITAGNGCKVRDGSIPLYWYDAMSLPPGVPSCYNSHNQQWCCGAPVTPQMTCNITTTGLTSKGTTNITYPDGTTQTINRYEAAKGTAYPGAFKLDGTVSNGAGNVGVEIWRSKTSTECWYGDGATCSSEPSLSTRSSLTNSLTTNFDTANVEAGSYYIMCDAYQQYFGSQFKCSGSPFYQNYPADGWTFCGDNSRIQVDVENSIPPPPTGTCGVFNTTDATTPVTWTWTNGTGLQVKDSTEYWWYNAAAPSPTTISSKDNAGTIPGIPPGRTVYARTTYDWSTFSSWDSVTCPLPANQTTVVNGVLRQKSGTSCYQADASNNFNLSTFSTTTGDSCVTTSCAASPSTTNATEYNCTITWDNQACVAQGRQPNASQTLSLAATSSGYDNGQFSNASCSLNGTTLPVTAGSSASADVTFNFSGENWMKLKNSSFNGVSITGITVPAFITSYDSDDDGLKYFASGVGGSVLNTTVQPNTAYSNPNNWYANPYSQTSLFDPSIFLSYVQSRKQYSTLSSLSANLASDITEAGIYYYASSPSQAITAGPTVNAVLIVNGNVTIGSNITSSGFALLVNGTITISPTVTQLNGVYIANSFDTGQTNNQGLKIVGNLMVKNSFTNQRAWSDTSRPGLFVILDLTQYVNLLPYLSIAKYDQTIQ